MSKLLHISSSPRGARSESLALASHFLQVYRTQNPADDIDEWDLWDGTLPSFGPSAVAAKMDVFAGVPLAGDRLEAWNAARAAFDRFASADKLLFSVPMWNGSVPYILKQLIDVISQPGLVFSFDGTLGYSGLLTGRKAAAIYTSAVYGPGRGPSFGSDLQQPYLEDWLRWTGITDVSAVSFRPNLATADADAGRTLAQTDATELAKRF